MRIDEHMMAGYVTGELTDAERAGVTAALLRDADLREMLHMATEALSAAKRGEKDGSLMRLMPDMEPSRPGIPREDRRALPSETHSRRTG